MIKKKTKKKLILYLCGGLGNQLFQYAAAKNIAIKNNADLDIDNFLGFFLDFRWKNNSNLKKIKHKKTFLIFWIYRLLKIFIKKKIYNNLLFEKLIDETSLTKASNNIINYKIRKKIYLMGFFQSEKYFVENNNKILKDLLPSKPNSSIFIKYQKLISVNSVAICIRSYEGLPNKIQKSMGGVSPISFYKKSIKQIIKYVPNPIFFLFSTRNDNIKALIDKIDYLKKNNYYIISSENGFCDAYSNLWLLSHFRNLIISNSSLYWWGAYFAKYKVKNTKVFFANNFVNKDYKF